MAVVADIADQVRCCTRAGSPSWGPQGDLRQPDPPLHTRAARRPHPTSAARGRSRHSGLTPPPGRRGRVAPSAPAASTPRGVAIMRHPPERKRSRRGALEPLAVVGALEILMRWERLTGVPSSSPPSSRPPEGTLLEVRRTSPPATGAPGARSPGLASPLAPASACHWSENLVLGNTMLSRCIVGLHSERTGTISFRGFFASHYRFPREPIVRPSCAAPDSIHLPEPLPLAEPPPNGRR